MIQTYIPGRSVVHRMPATAKLALFALLALAVTAYPHDAASIGMALAGVCALYLVSGIPFATLIVEVWRLRWLILVLGVGLWVFVSPLTAWISTARVVALVLLATLLTLTTRMESLLRVLHRLLTPLGRFGIDPRTVSMTIALALTMVPTVARFSTEVRDAASARGIRLRIRWIVPLLVRTLRHADDVGDALAARGLV
ncbi:CbiQ family ECF transporter T component [Microbacterium hydrocarbonoxydans]|uniref:Biotin transport system permease protein n=1 Tax=Microbacterium hydrocarbonoxydans TaxID=273678 RepID=A0A1H4LGJ6_9MICO|nr:CbiQ family ECF transporter T component [Microbacterium hydrocarbonoxydans]SEB69402.1 biotin transport system permease protein [Microbacterium hydrocarbonoxydans]